MCMYTAFCVLYRSLNKNSGIISVYIRSRLAVICLYQPVKDATNFETSQALSWNKNMLL